METGPDLALMNSLISQANAALSLWGLQDQQPELLKYRENAVFRIRLADGSPAALRLHRPGYHSQNALESELAWMGALHEGGVRVPESIPTPGGQILMQVPSTDHPSGIFADIVSWIVGTPLGASGIPLAKTSDELELVFSRIGQTMAGMHNVTDHWIVPAGFDRPSWDLDGLVGDQPLWGRFWDCPGLSVTERNELVKIRDVVGESLGAPAIRSLDFGLIHADLVRENIMVNSSDIALIDFDDCGFGWRMFEIATALLKNRKEPHFELIRQSLIEGYRSKRPLSEEALATLPLFMLVRSLTYIGWSAARIEEPGMQARLQRSIVESRDLFEQFHRR